MKFVEERSKQHHSVQMFNMKENFQLNIQLKFKND